MEIEVNEKKREIAEMIWIKKDPEACNLKTDTKDLSVIYSHLISEVSQLNRTNNLTY